MLPAPFPACTGAGAARKALHGWSPQDQGSSPADDGQHGRVGSGGCPALAGARRSLNASLIVFFFAGELFVETKDEGYPPVLLLARTLGPFMFCKQKLE